MNDTLPDFDYMLNEIERSRLPRQKGAAFAMMLLDADPGELAEMALAIREGRQSIELLGLISLSRGKAIAAGLEHTITRLLTQEEELIKDATVSQK